VESRFDYDLAIDVLGVVDVGNHCKMSGKDVDPTFGLSQGSNLQTDVSLPSHSP
jgi:hypothetical protein